MFSTINPTQGACCRSLLGGLFCLGSFDGNGLKQFGFIGSFTTKMSQTNFFEGFRSSSKPHPMFRSVLTGRDHNKIFNFIIRDITIYVMNMFRFIEVTAKMLLHNQSMLRNIALSVAMRMVSSKNKSITVPVSNTAAISMAFRTLLRFTNFCVAFGGSSNTWTRTKFSLSSLFVKGEQFSTSRAIHDNEYISCALVGW